MRATPGNTPTPFGRQLRYWRRVRGISQLDLAVHAGVSSRHISFMETGRSRPSSPMVLRLTETLDLPLRERNELLRAAGFPPAFPQRGLDEPEMAPVRSIVDHMLRHHNPYPAFLLDRLWNLLDANETARKIFPVPAGDEVANALELFLGPGAFRDMVDNWAEVAWTTLTRLRREVLAGGPDPDLARLLARGEEHLRDVPAPLGFDPDSPVIAPRLRLGDQTLSTVSAIAHFNAARDVTLEELRVELVFPADSAAERFFEALSAS